MGSDCQGQDAAKREGTRRAGGSKGSLLDTSVLHLMVCPSPASFPPNPARLNSGHTQFNLECYIQNLIMVTEREGAWQRLLKKCWISIFTPSPAQPGGTHSLTVDLALTDLFSDALRG